MTAWQEFIIENGWHASAHDLAHVLGVDVDQVNGFRRASKRSCKPLPQRLGFAELFARWHGRPPADEEWPAPRLEAGRSYAWQPPELALLARLVGTMSPAEIAVALTERLRHLTGDPAAVRNADAVRIAINHRLGLQAGADLVGGLTTKQAANIVGVVSLVNQAIASGHLRTFRVGKRHVIPRAEFDRWMATREQPPEGWVRLASLAVPLGIESDSKLPEYAKLGYIPNVRLVQGIGTARGLWFIHPDTAKQILADAAAGRPMPWHGKPLPGNQRVMWKKWQARKHRYCRKCTAIWKGKAPVTFEQFCARYAELTRGQKQHLTVDLTKDRGGSIGWRPRGSVIGRMRAAGVTVPEAAAELQQRTRWVRMWIRRGLLEQGGIVRDALGGEAVRITPLGIAMLKAALAEENATLADRYEGIGVHEAAQIAGVCVTTIHRWRKDGELRNRNGVRGILFEQESLKARARRYWVWALKRFRRAQPPEWLRHELEADILEHAS